ncbi:MAG: FkbM family methyltransferase [Candidatus Accumulibacter sp.]|jgi:FkbM family methyltransferase|nr:FkbM family methyltransferase [Accumulibacter sp.]
MIHTLPRIVREKILLRNFRKELDKIEKRIPMQGSYARLSPYIIDCSQGGHAFRFIIYHTESKSWFDVTHEDGVLGDIDRNGMLKPGDIAFDLGCNSGYMSTAFAQRVGPTGRVVCFDPYPWNALATKYNALLNGFDNVDVFEVGIGKEEATMTISAADAKTVRNTHCGFQVRIRPLSAYAHYRPTFMKIDIEGSEADIADGPPLSSVSDRLRDIALEFHIEFIRQRGVDPRRVLRKFLEQGYSARRWGTRGNDSLPIGEAWNCEPVTAIDDAHPPEDSSENETLGDYYSLHKEIDMEVNVVTGDTAYFSGISARLENRPEEIQTEVMKHVDYLAEKAGMSRVDLLAGGDFQAHPQVLADARENIDAVLRDRSPADTTNVEDIIKLAEKNLEGWCTREKAAFIAQTITRESPDICVEIGVYGGRLLIPAAAALKKNKMGVIYGIETWSPEAAIEYKTSEGNDDWWSNLDFHPIKTNFLRFVAEQGLASQVRIVEVPSADAASLFKRIDYLHIDGAHSVYNAAEDVVLYGKKVVTGGIIILDDANWPTVAPAIAILDSFCERIASFHNEKGEEDCIAFRKKA